MVSLIKFFFVLLFLTSCQISHLWHVSTNHLKILSSKQSIEDVLKNPNLSIEHRRKIELTQEVRKFAFEKLRLKKSKNYSDYVDLGRSHVVYNVTASERWKFQPYKWSFPIIGEAPYKGFYREELAKEEASELENKGYDTRVAGVSAYSTLGYLNDPLLSSMLNYSDYGLANTIIHELVHTHLFIKDNIDFNERLAVFVANKGTAMFYLEREGEKSPTLQKVKDENSDDEEFSKFITLEIQDLKKWYNEFDHSKNLPTDEKEAMRTERLQQIAKNFELNLKPKLKTRSYSKLFGKKINNADLIGFNTYMKNLDVFEKVYQKFGANIPDFLTKCQELNDADDVDATFANWADTR